MMTKKLLTATAVLTTLVASFSAYADEPKSASLYVEGQLGYADLTKVDAQWTGTSGNLTATGLSGKLDYDSSMTYGAEIGLKDVLIPNLRIGASYTTMKFDLKNAEMNGVVTNGTTTYTNQTVSGSTLNTFGMSLDNRVNLYMINAYYDFKTFTGFTPFVGIGIGLADIKNAKDLEFAYDLNVGAKYNITQNIYVGIKGAYTRVMSPTDQTGIKFDDIDAYSANAALGFEF